MKIGLICRGRTRSSIIQDSLSKKHKLINNFEIYLRAQKVFKKGNDLNNNFQTELKNITNTIFLKQNFICKLWPSMLIHRPHMFENNQSFDDIKNKIIFNISEYFRISEYDELYYLNRDLHHSTFSWVYRCKRIKLMNYLQPNIPLVITIDDIDLSIARFYILEYCLQEKIKDFLNEQQIPYIDITETYNQYIDNKIDTIPSNNDYNKLITNSDMLPKFIDDWYNICCENITDWKYY
jgi:hypothetical protein